MGFKDELCEHWRLFRQEARPVIGAEGLLGVLALYQFVKSLVQPSAHVALVHGRLVERHGSIHPSYGWLCIVLGVALFAEGRVVHRLLRAHGPESELIKLTPKQLAEYRSAVEAPQEPMGHE